MSVACAQCWQFAAPPHLPLTDHGAVAANEAGVQELVHQGHLTVAEDFFANTSSVHDPTTPTRPQGPAAIKET